MLIPWPLPHGRIVLVTRCNNVVQSNPKHILTAACPLPALKFSGQLPKLRLSKNPVGEDGWLGWMSVVKSNNSVTVESSSSQIPKAYSKT